MLVRFWINHHLLDLFQRPLWRVVRGRSETYVKHVCRGRFSSSRGFITACHGKARWERCLLLLSALSLRLSLMHGSASELPDVRTSTAVTRVVRDDGGVVVETAAGGRERFDAVVFATHSDVTLQLLGDDVDPQERSVLAGVPYNDNDIYLHSGKMVDNTALHAWTRVARRGFLPEINMSFHWILLCRSGPYAAQPQSVVLMELSWQQLAWLRDCSCMRFILGQQATGVASRGTRPVRDAQPAEPPGSRAYH